MKKAISLILALAMVLSLAACGSSGGGNSQTPSDSSNPPETSAPTYNVTEEVKVTANSETLAEKKTEDGWLVVGVTTASVGFDPTSDQNYYGIPYVYDSLFTYDDDGNIVPLLAKEYEWVDDLHLKITLQDNATFSNGDPITSEDAIYSIQRYFTKGSRWNTYFTSIDFDNTEIVDDKTFILAYTDVTGCAMSYLATRHTSVLDKDYLESAGEDALWDNFPASGPYVCTENVSGSHFILERRDDYWGDLPAAKYIKVVFYSETTTLMVDYENGAIDLAIGITDNDVTRVKNGEVDHTNLTIKGYYNQFSLCLPEYMEIFDDIRIRQAISLAIDSDTVAETVFGSLQQPSTSTLPADVAFQTEIGRHEYDPEKALSLLEEAGVKPGDITLRMVVVNFPHLVDMAEAIQAYLESVGITLTIEPYAQPVAVSYFQACDTDMVLNNNAEGVISGDPDQWYNTTKSNSTNGSVRITDEDYNSYLNAGLYTQDESVRAEAYANAQQWMADNYRMISICDGLMAYVYKDYISYCDCYTPMQMDFRTLTFAE